MSGLGRVIVGFPEGDRRVAAMWEERGHVAVPHRGCISCGVLVYFMPSGADAIRSRDPEVICERCYREHEREVVMEL